MKHTLLLLSLILLSGCTNHRNGNQTSPSKVDKKVVKPTISTKAVF